MSLLRQAQFATSQDKPWWIWSINEDTVSCLPYSSTTGDELCDWIWDLKEFPISEIINVTR